MATDFSAMLSRGVRDGLALGASFRQQVNQLDSNFKTQFALGQQSVENIMRLGSEASKRAKDQFNAELAVAQSERADQSLALQEEGLGLRKEELAYNVSNADRSYAMKERVQNFQEENYADDFGLREQEAENKQGLYDQQEQFNNRWLEDPAAAAAPALAPSALGGTGLPGPMMGTEGDSIEPPSLLARPPVDRGLDGPQAGLLGPVGKAALTPQQAVKDIDRLVERLPEMTKADVQRLDAGLLGAESSGLARGAVGAGIREARALINDRLNDIAEEEDPRSESVVDRRRRDLMEQLDLSLSISANEAINSVLNVPTAFDTKDAKKELLNASFAKTADEYANKILDSVENTEERKKEVEKKKGKLLTRKRLWRTAQEMMETAKGLGITMNTALSRIQNSATNPTVKGFIGNDADSAPDATAPVAPAASAAATAPVAPAAATAATAPKTPPTEAPYDWEAELGSYMVKPKK